MERKRSVKIVAVLAGLVLAVGLPSIVSTAQEDGYWAEVGGYSCPAGQVCADWFQADGSYSGYRCCIQPEQLGSSNPDACTGAAPSRDREREFY